MKMLGIIYGSNFKTEESLISPTCNIETKASCKWKLPKGDYVGSKARFKIDEAVSSQGNSANIKLVAVGPTVGFQLREWKHNLPTKNTGSRQYHK